MNLNFQIYSQTTFKAKILVVEWSLPVLCITLKMTTVDRVKYNFGNLHQLIITVLLIKL